MLSNKGAIAWSLYDWANSAFATTIIAGFFPVFFKEFWSVDTDPSLSTARLGLANSVSGMLIAASAPLLGAIADRTSAKKKLLFFFAYSGALMTCLLYLVGKGNWQAAILIYAAAGIGFSGGNIFYDSLLPLVCPKEEFDFVSSFGYALGYLGGGLLFAFNVYMVLYPDAFGFAGKAEAIRYSFVTVGLWWAFFTIPLILFVKEPKTQKKTSCFGALRDGVSELWATFSQIRGLKPIYLFLIAYWIYIDGIDTIIRMAVDYGISLGFDSTDLIVALLITQFVGFPSAIAFGYLGGKIGANKAILIGITVYFFVSLWGMIMSHKYEFYLLAVVIGTTQGGLQALSRSYFAAMIPQHKSAEFFGFYNMLGKFAVMIGPVFMGGICLAVRSMGYSNQIASRASIASLCLFFLVGGAVFVAADRSNRKKGPRG